MTPSLSIRCNRPSSWVGALLLAVACAVAPLTALAAGAQSEETPKVELRYSIKVAKHGKGTTLRRLALSYPTGGTLTAVCTKAAMTDPCQATGSPVEGLRCAAADASTTKCELRSTKARPLHYAKGAGIAMNVIRPGYRSTTLEIRFTGNGRYRASVH